MKEWEARYEWPIFVSFLRLLTLYDLVLFFRPLRNFSKTYTMSGDKLSYENRGIIPRAISHIFRAMNDRPDLAFRINVSYVEIYNGQSKRSSNFIYRLLYRHSL